MNNSPQIQVNKEYHPIIGGGFHVIIHINVNNSRGLNFDSHAFEFTSSSSYRYNLRAIIDTTKRRFECRHIPIEYNKIIINNPPRHLVTITKYDQLCWSLASFTRIGSSQFCNRTFHKDTLIGCLQEARQNHTEIAINNSKNHLINPFGWDMYELDDDTIVQIALTYG